MIAPSRGRGGGVLGGVGDLSDGNHARLADLERTVLCWMGIVGEPVSIEELLALLGVPVSRSQMLEAVDGLRRRLLIERGQLQGSFTLQSVVLEYVTAQLIEQPTSEIEQGRPIRLIDHGLHLTTARDSLRQTQERLLRRPLLI